MSDYIDSVDFMARSTTLRVHGATRTFFDPANIAHCESLKNFMETGSWGKIQFYPEFPYTEVPATVMAKYVAHSLKVQHLSLSEKAARASQRRSELAATALRNLSLGEIVNVKQTRSNENT